MQIQRALTFSKSAGFKIESLLKSTYSMKLNILSISGNDDFDKWV